ncbi:MAG: amidohydrolase family protein [Bacteroidetes bacterium]|jgi:predicted amidohydrolase YtcJ|nr:amidohydrolase family protein [Bacteroidota bacterium]
MYRLPLVAPLLAFALSLLLIGCDAADDASPDPADLVLLDGRVVTVDDDLPEAEAIAIAGNEILAVGSSEEIRTYVGTDTEVIELAGRLAMPGFIEGHGHFLGVGEMQLQLNLRDVANWREIVAMVEEAAADAAEGEVIMGRGWHQEDWDERPEPAVDDLPVHDALSAASPDHPVVLTHASGHMRFANAEAMRLAGITADTPDPEGGEIVRDADGNATGVFRQNAQGLLSPATERWNPDVAEMAERAAQDALAKGITTVHDAGTPFARLAELRDIAEAGDLDIRLWMMARDSNKNLRENLADFRVTRLGNDRLTIGGVKKAIDGALGTHGAWMLEPYADRDTHAGFNTTSMEEIEEAARLALAHDYQMAIHAIGDRGNRETLDLYERLFDEEEVDGEDLRWRIEHAQHLHPDDIERFARLGITASMQGVHATSDGPWVPQRVGEERAREGAYVWRSLLDSGALVTNGTDAPVEDIDPIESYYAMVTRHMADSTNFFEEQALTREEALRTYTINNAIAVFEDDIKGSLTPGKLADIVVLSDDILTIDAPDILNAQVDLTILGGAVVYARE